METSKFPMTYFNMAIKPKKMFMGRNSLKWYQKLFIMFFLLSLMLIPISIQSKNVPNIKLDMLFPNLVSQLSEDASNQELLKHIKVVDGTLDVSNDVYKSNTIMINPSKQEVMTKKNVLVFYANEMLLIDSEKSIQIAYPKSLEHHQPQSISELILMVEDSWNEQTIFYRTIIYTLLIGLLVFVSSVLLVLGTSLFIFMTRKNELSNIQSFGEATNLVINALFIPTLTASIFGMFHYDVSLMLTIQALGLALYILLIFIKTRFNDKVFIA